MFKQVIDECFTHLRERGSGETKTAFGYVWAIFASKKVCFRGETVFLSWRDLSAQLAIVYNDWFGLAFTTDAFLNVCNPDVEMGEDALYDEMFKCVYQHKDCTGIFKITNGVSAAATTDYITYIETDVVTGAEKHYRQQYNSGRPIGDPVIITKDEFGTIGLTER